MKTKRLRPLIVAATFIVISVFIMVITQPRFAPYALKIVSDDFFEVTHTTPIIESVNSSGQNLEIRKKDFDIAWISEDMKQQIFVPMIDDIQSIRDFWYDKDSSTLFVVESKGEYWSRYEQITRYTYVEKDEEWRAKILFFKNIGLYASTKILKYYPSSDTLLLNSSGGDGGGRGGEIWLLNDYGKQSIQLFSNPGTVDYLGFNGDKLYFANSKVNNPEESATYTSIYSQDPLTRVKRTIIDSSELPPVDLGHFSDPDSEVLYLLRTSSPDSLTKVYTLNINSEELEPIPSDQYFGHD